MGGALGSNNPIRELLKEASRIFGDDRRVAQIISIGCGVPHALSLEGMTSRTVAERLLKEMPTDCHMVAKELAARLLNVDAYIRLSVERGMENIGIDDWNMLEEVEMCTISYVETQGVTQALETSLKHLRRRIGMVTLAQLSTFRV